MIKLHEPVIQYTLEENFEVEYLRAEEYRKINPNAERFTTSAAYPQRMTKLAIDYSAQKVRGTVEVLFRVYDFATTRVVSSYTKKQVVHTSFHEEGQLPGESIALIE